MNNKLKDYLRQCTPAKADQPMLDELRREMDKAVPRITEKIRKREQLAAELRVTGSRPSRPEEQKED